MISVLGVLMGIDMQGFAREEGSNEMPPGFNAAPSSPPTSPPPTASSSSRPSQPPAEDTKMAEPEPEDNGDAQKKKEAEAEKKKGTDAYKKRDFDVALAAFEKAWEIWPGDITYLTNAGGTFKSVTVV